MWAAAAVVAEGSDTTIMQGVRDVVVDWAFAAATTAAAASTEAQEVDDILIKDFHSDGNSRTKCNHAHELLRGHPRWSNLGAKNL